MKRYSPALSLALAGALILMSSCNTNKAKVSGRFIGADKQALVLQGVSPTGSAKADTVLTDGKGNFKFSVKLPDSQTTLYNLTVGEESIPLFISPGEKIEISSFYENPRNYNINGSEESSLLKEVNDILRNGTFTLDSIAQSQSLFNPTDEQRQANARAYLREYQRIKREQIRFIVSNNGSLAAIYALSQRLPNDDVLFNGDSDIIYYRSVAEKVAENYPDSPYLASLQKDIAAFDNTEEILRNLQEQLDNPSSFPDIEMPDIYGEKQKLSDRTGLVILLDFWSTKFEQNPVVNAEYRELYNEFNSKGFTIYQVSIDDSRPEWVSAVQNQKLPWTTVFDTKGSGNYSARVYNVNTIPANYLISAGGDIVERNLFGDELRKAVEREVRKVKR